MIRKGVLVLLCMLLIALPVYGEIGSVHHTRPISSNIVVTMLNQDPDPVEPGEMVEVRFKIENTLGQTLEDVHVELQPTHPFSPYGTTLRNIGKLQGAQTGADAAIVDFRLKVDEDAVEGENEIELRVRVADDLYQVFNENEFMIDVDTVDAILRVDQVVVAPETISPGKTGSISFRLVNDDDTSLKNIHVKLDLDDVSISPHQSTNEQWVKRLSPGFKKTLEFPIIIDPKAEGGVHQIPVEFTFNDQRGSNFSKTDVVSIQIGGTPLLRTYLRDKDVYQSGKGGKIVVEIANPTPLDVKFLEMELEDSDTYRLLSANNFVYIGDVDSDDTESETFDVYLNAGVNQVQIPISLRYQDPNNNVYEDEVTLTIDPLTRKQMVQYGLAQSSQWMTIFLVIAVLAVGGYMYWRRRRRQKKND